MAFVFTPPDTTSIAIAGSEQRFPVRRVFCVGRNYAAHAREMGKDPNREPPFFFTKPTDAVTEAGGTIPYPLLTDDFQYEIELVVAIGKGGVALTPDAALDHVFGYAVGIDLTRRDLQMKARDMGRPWDWGKAFDLSAPIAPIRPGRGFDAGRIWLNVNGQIKQDADIADLIWPVADIISQLSESVEIQPGDIIMTGTPAGVGPIVPGDLVTGGVDGLGEISITIGERAHGG